MTRMLAVAALLCLASPSLSSASDKPAAIKWQGFSDDLFEKAEREKRLVLLDLEAVWCHWCHVMDETTYQDPRVVEILEKGYICVKVDQDSRPDLSNRYEDYGWPATILFDSKGQELAKLSGYIVPGRMASLLQAFLDDPTPGPSAALSPSGVGVGPHAMKEMPRNTTDVATSSALAPELKKTLVETHFTHYDPEFGSWGTVHKFLHGDSLEYTLELAGGGALSPESLGAALSPFATGVGPRRTRERAPQRQAQMDRAAGMVRQTLDANLKLIDPAWGGVYQYSHGGTWDNPHFEKIMWLQATNLRMYALGYARYKDPRYLAAALGVERYLFEFLRSPEGAFYTSQDADLKPGEHSGEYFALPDAERRAQGIPRIDTHVYARENGWAIEAVTLLSDVTGDPEHGKEAARAAEWILKERSLPGGGFRHDAVDKAGPYMGDSLAMGRAFLGLYISTGNRIWLQRAEAAARFIAESFSSEAGFATAKASPKVGYRPQPQRDENIQFARFTNLLFHHTGNGEYKKWAEHAMRYLATPDVAELRPTAGILIADAEVSSDPTHITVVGRKSDPKALELYRAALRHPATYRRIEWWDRAEGPMPNPDIQYPELGEAAAFACASNRCSRPISDPAKISETVERFRQQALEK